VPKWVGPFLISKVRDNGNIRIQLDKNDINVNVNRIKPFIATNHKGQQQQQQPQMTIPQPMQDQAEQKEEKQQWIEVKRHKQPQIQQPVPDVPKRGRGRPRKHMGPPKDKVNQFEPRWTRARQIEEGQKQVQKAADADAHIEELIKTGNIAAFIKTEQQKWNACLIKTGPSSYVITSQLWKKTGLIGRETKQLEYCNRTASSSANSSNYDTPPGSLAPTPAKPKGKLKKNIEQVSKVLSFC